MWSYFLTILCKRNEKLFFNDPQANLQQKSVDIDIYLTQGGQLEKSDLDLIDKYAKENSRLDRLYKEHLRLEEEIESLQSLKIMSPVDNKRLKELKKVKLAGRDEMEKIFQTLRESSWQIDKHNELPRPQKSS